MGAESVAAHKTGWAGELQSPNQTLTAHRLVAYVDGSMMPQVRGLLRTNRVAVVVAVHHCNGAQPSPGSGMALEVQVMSDQEESACTSACCSVKGSDSPSAQTLPEYGLEMVRIAGKRRVLEEEKGVA